MPENNDKAKVLVFDIETAPSTAYIWRMWKENVGLEQLENEGYVLCWAAKWLDSDEVMSRTTKWGKPEDDRNVVESLWKLLDEADIVIAHNGKKFDVPVMNARFAVHKLGPPSNYKIIDTLAIAKAKFRFISNKLDALGKFLGLGRKTKHAGFGLWRGCMEGDEQSWKKMIEYNKQDVLLLEAVYKALRPWDSQHPALPLYGEQDSRACNVCGSTHVHQKGYDYTKTHTYKRWKCQECGHNMRERFNSDDKTKNKNILSST